MRAAGLKVPAAAMSHEGAMAGDSFSDDQILHLIGAFVGIERLGIGEEACEINCLRNSVLRRFQLASTCRTSLAIWIVLTQSSIVIMPRKPMIIFDETVVSGTVLLLTPRLKSATLSPAVRPSDYDATLRAAIERVVVSRTTIEIELAEAMASDDQNRILIIPWTPPSPHRRREIIQGEGERPSATRPMRTEARAVLTDALRDAHCWLDELSTSPNLKH
jgi:hypothetical protein